MGRRDEGLFVNPGKYEVRRTDGTDAPGGKHHGCALFVLDLTHDRAARAALRAYIDSCRRSGYFQLAEDLSTMLSRAEAGLR